MKRDPASGATGRRLLDATSEIAAALCEAAIWDADRATCSWEGTDVLSPLDNEPTPVIRVLDGDLYGGTSGIALFLAQAHCVSPDDRFRTCALGGLRKAIAWADGRERGPMAISLFSGVLGIAYAIRASPVFRSDPHFGTEARRILDDAMADFMASPKDQGLDVINGAAGAIPVLLGYHESAKDRRYLEFAHLLGRDVCARADWTSGYCNWDSGEAARFDAPPLGGFSHGASGIAYALLKLFQATGDEELLVTARGAYAYEDTLYDPSQRNWIDMRHSMETNDRDAEAPVYWCHGAAGILLSRAAAAGMDLAESDRHSAIVRLAAERTLAALDRALASPGSDATICHGISGLIEALHVASVCLREPALKTAAIAGADILIGRHSPDRSWPSGVLGNGYNPSLMVGTAGIGYTLLRLAVPQLPCIALMD